MIPNRVRSDSKVYFKFCGNKRIPKAIVSKQVILSKYYRIKTKTDSKTQNNVYLII